MYMVASIGLTQTYTNDQLVTTGLNDYSLEGSDLVSGRSGRREYRNGHR
jgi:hypothetical protein